MRSTIPTVKDTIPFSDFAKLDLRIGEVREAGEVEGSTKLLRLLVDFGDEIGLKTIYAGVKEWYEPSKLTGRKLAFVVNLEPKKFIINSVELVSEGMLVAADEGGRAVLYTFDQDLPPGSPLR